MLVAAQEYTTASAGLVEQKAFSVEMNAMLFHTVISGIYADKISSMMREISTNAFDSHRDAGKADVPFEVQLPSYLNPLFRVRDFGTSLTHEQVMGIYTTMFASSKRESNDAVGMIGLGSKSPFAYTSVFTITCWKDGQKRIYSAFLGDNGVPQLGLIQSLASDAPTGLEISVAVERRDIDAFRQKAFAVFFPFDPYPTIVNEQFTAASMATADVLFKGDDWTIFGDGVPFTRMMAKQGCVLYPIDAAALGNSFQEFEGLLKRPVVIDFPIGQLEVATSREALAYTKETVANIAAALGRVQAELGVVISQEFAACPSYLDACLLRVKASYEKRALFNLVGQALTWGDRPLVDFLNRSALPAGTEFMQFERGIEVTKYRATLSFRPSASTHFSVVDMLETIVVHYVNVKTKFHAARMRNFLQTAPSDKNVIWVRLNRESELDMVLDALGNPAEVVDLSTIEPLRNVQGAKDPNALPKMVLRLGEVVEKIRWNGSAHIKYLEYEFKDQLVTLTDELLFVVSEDRSIRLNGYHTYTKSDHLARDLNNLLEWEILDLQQIVIVQRSKLDRFRALCEAQPLGDVLKAKVREILPTIETMVTVDNFDWNTKDFLKGLNRRLVEADAASIPVPQEIRDLSKVTEADFVPQGKVLANQSDPDFQFFKWFDSDAWRRRFYYGSVKTNSVLSEPKHLFPLLRSAVENPVSFQHYMELLNK